MHASDLDNFLQSQLMAAIACLKTAQRHLDKKETTQALRLFQQIRTLGELVNEIPIDVEGHELLLGVQELSQQQYNEAREHFQKCRPRGSHSNRIARRVSR